MESDTGPAPNSNRYTYKLHQLDLLQLILLVKVIQIIKLLPHGDSGILDLRVIRGTLSDSSSSFQHHVAAMAITSDGWVITHICPADLNLLNFFPFGSFCFTTFYIWPFILFGRPRPPLCNTFKYLTQRSIAMVTGHTARLCSWAQGSAVT